MVIVEVQQQAVGTAAELQQRVDKLKKDGKKMVVLLVVQSRRRNELSWR